MPKKDKPWTLSRALRFPRGQKKSACACRQPDIDTHPWYWYTSVEISNFPEHDAFIFIFSHIVRIIYTMCIKMCRVCMQPPWVHFLFRARCVVFVCHSIGDILYFNKYVCCPHALIRSLSTSCYYSTDLLHYKHLQTTVYRSNDYIFQQ